ncbi:MAG: arginine--tRNA ligase [Parcubacteria group bacterium]|nr:arginine--tRNA ligase [Parcubacteria group bacterium]
MKELIKTYLNDIIRKIAPEFRGEVLVKVTENREHGDYSSNVAFLLAKILSAQKGRDLASGGKKSPQIIAEELVKKLNSQKISAFTPSYAKAVAGKKVSADKKEFSKIDAVNGFINFFLSPECLRHQLKEVLKEKNKYGNSDVGKNYKVQVEFISANPTGPLTMANGRGGFYGDVLANILETQGYNITREFYINDRGGQILALGRSIKLAQGENLSLEKTELENLYKGDYINDLAKQIDKNFSIEEAGQASVDLILNTHIKPVIKKLGINFDVWFSEKSLYKGGQYEKVMEDLMRKDLIYEKDGATWMKTSELGDTEDRVLIKSNGDETYFMSDILYHLNKFEVRKFNKAINIWGADHHGDIPRLMGALKALGINSERLKIVLIQFVRLVSGGKKAKVSKRAGIFVTLDELVGEIGLDAVRFFFLMYSSDTHMDFDLSLAKERSQKNPIYYVQYAYARLSSILRKAKVSNLRKAKVSKAEVLSSEFSALKTNAEFDLIRKLTEFPEVLSDIAINYEVHRLPRYALELAREFHNFYEKERVITEDKKLTSARLALVTATKIVLGNALNLMGIKAPDKM